MPPKMNIFLDIETLPPAEAERDYYRAQYEEYLKTTARSENLPTFESYFRDLSLDAATGRLLTIGVIVEKGGVITSSGCFGRDRTTGKFHLDERRTLESFWKHLRGFETGRDLLVGHNVLNFDLLFLLRRSAIFGIVPKVIFSLNKYKHPGVFDTMHEWSNQQKWVKLTQLAHAFKLPNPKDGGIDGSQIYAAYLAGRDTEIAEYCMRDVECAREVYYRMNYSMPPIGAASFQITERSNQLTERSNPPEELGLV